MKGQTKKVFLEIVNPVDNIVQTPFWLFTCFAQCSFNNEIVDCRGNLLITKENDCKRKARAKFRSSPHWVAGIGFTISQETGLEGMRTGAPNSVCTNRYIPAVFF